MKAVRFSQRAVRCPACLRKTAVVAASRRFAHDGPVDEKGRRNALNIQMISEGLYRQIFKQPSSSLPIVQEEDFNKIQRHLEKFDLWDKEPTTFPEVDFKIPDLEGE